MPSEFVTELIKMVPILRLGGDATFVSRNDICIVVSVKFLLQDDF